MAAKKPKLGSGGRFKALASKIEKQGKSKKSAEAIAASIGISKFGKKKMTKLATAGAKRAAKKRAK